MSSIPCPWYSCTLGILFALVLFDPVTVWGQTMPSGWSDTVRVRKRPRILEQALRSVRSTTEPISAGADSIRSNSKGSVPVTKRKTERRKYDFTKNGGVVYCKSDQYELKCDIYVPDGEGPYPAILAVHGGGWRWGSKFQMLRHAWLMAEAGYVVVAINYRHAPEYRFPAQVHDCRYAVRWMRAHAEEYRIDPSRIGAFGYSAGGHLVSLLGTSEPEDDFREVVPEYLRPFSPTISAVVAGGAPCEFSWVNKTSPMLTYWLGETRSQNPEKYELASPTCYVSADDPPFYFFHAAHDFVVPMESAKSLHRKLSAVGVESRFDIAPWSDHIIAFSRLQYMKRGIDFFDRHLGPRGAQKVKTGDLTSPAQPPLR